MLYFHARNKTIFALALLIAGCATNSYRPIQADPVKVSTDSTGPIPIDIAVDAYTIRRSSLFDSTTAKRIEGAVQQAKDEHSASVTIRNIVCDGEKPRVKPSLQFHLVLNRPIPSTPVDVVAQKNRLLISEVPFYLKAYWLHEASRPELLDKQVNPDFDEYYRTVVETNGERKTTNRIHFGIPFFPGASKQDIKKFFANAHAVPTLKRFADKGPIEWFPSKSLLSVEVGPHDYILSNKVANVFSGLLSEGISKGEEYINNDVQFEPTTTVQQFSQQDGVQFRTYANYAVSQNAWKIRDGNIIQPLVIAHLTDLAWLRKLFVFRIPKPDLERLFGISSPDALKYFGYDYSGRFSAKTSLEFQDYTWKRMLENQTEVLSTTNEDASIRYEVRPILDAFCRWAIPVSSLRASD